MLTRISEYFHDIKSCIIQSSDKVIDRKMCHISWKQRKSEKFDWDVFRMYENINEILKKDIILQGIGTARKNIFSFSKYSEKIVFPQNCTGIWPFLYHQDWWYFFSLKTWSYSLDVKWKMICLKKYLEILYFLQMFWNDALSKKIAVEYDLSCIIREDGFFFSRKYDFFSMDEKWKMIFLKKYMEIWCFLYIEWRWYFFFP